MPWIGIVVMPIRILMSMQILPQVLQMLENPKIISTVIHISASLHCFIFLVIVTGVLVFNILEIIFYFVWKRYGI
jgi:hypothetical protein